MYNYLQNKYNSVAQENINYVSQLDATVLLTLVLLHRSSSQNCQRSRALSPAINLGH